MQNMRLAWKNVKNHAREYRSHVFSLFCEIYTLVILRFIYDMKFVGHEGRLRLELENKLSRLEYQSVGLMD